MSAVTTTAIAVGSVVSAGMSFSQAAKQKGIIADAEAEAEKKMKQARASLEKNYMESLSIPKAAFEAQNEAILVAGSAALDAARDGSQRGVGTVAQNVLNAQNDALRDASIRQEQQLFNLEAATAEEESRLRDARASLDLQEAEGAQMAAADAAEARNDAIQQGIGAVTEGVGAGLESAALYAVDKAKQKAVLQGMSDDGLIDFNPSEYGRGKDFEKGYKKRDYRKLIRGFNFQDPEYLMRYGALGNEKYYNSGFGGYIDGRGSTIPQFKFNEPIYDILPSTIGNIG